MERNKLDTAQAQVPISKKPTGVFYIDGNKAFYFEQTLSSPIALDIPTDIIANFELLNKKKLKTLLATFIQNYKLVPKNIVLLLSAHVTFDKDFPHGSIEVQKNIQEFLELVPFEDMLDKKIVASGKTRVVATNKEICDAVKQAFTASKFIVSGIYPLSQCMEVVPQLKTSLDLSLFVNKISDLKAFNLQPIVEAAIHTQTSVALSDNEKPNKSRLILLVGIFGILLLVLGYVVNAYILSPGNEQKPQANQLPPPTLRPVSPTPVSQLTPVVTQGSAAGAATPIPTKGVSPQTPISNPTTGPR